LRFPVINGIFNLYCFDFCLRISSYPQRFLVHFVKMVLATKTFCTRTSPRLCAFSARGALEHRSTRRGGTGRWENARPRGHGSVSVCGSACTACCIRSARRSPSCSCALSRAPGQTRRPAACRAPGPGMLGPGRCGCARFCAPGRSRRPAARRPPRTRPDPQSAGTGVPAFRRVFACSPRAVWSMLYTPAPAFTPCAPSNASKLQQTETAATNSWLFCSPCGRRFGADAGTQRTCNIDALHEQTSLGGRDRLVWQTVTD